MDEQKKKRCLEILELPFDATWQEIAESYYSLKKLYSAPSLALAPVEEEFSEARRQEVARQLDEAFGELERIFACSARNLEKNIKSMVSEIEQFNGPALRAVRQKLGLAPDDIARETRIPPDHLEHLENQVYGELPLEIYVIGYLKNYARLLALDPKRVTADYMQGYAAWRRRQPDI